MIQASEGIRLRAILSGLDEAEKALQSQQHIADLPTRAELPAVNLTPITGSILPIDDQGRAYLLINNPFENILDLVKCAVERFHKVQKSYPTVIILGSPFDFVTIGWLQQHFQTENGTRIPYGFENGVLKSKGREEQHYHVLVR